MNIIKIIEKKRDKFALSKEEIHFFVNAYCADQIADYQASSLLMAMYLNGLNKAETMHLCEAMIESGEVLDLSHIKGFKVDKHSSGGVGDKTTLALACMLNAHGLVVAKMSGRGLGHTGGTLDKLESMKGFNVNLSKDSFIKQLEKIGIAIISQNENMVLADKKIYALRDVTGTISSIPLIATSIMSKKIASGADYILLDVKYGDGAFMETKEKAEELARLMIEIGTHFKRIVKVEITSMEEPLGNAIGNALEVQEAIDTLLNKGPEDFTNLCVHSGALLLYMCKQCRSLEEGKYKMQEVIQNGSAYQKFLSLINAQGASECIQENIIRLPHSKFQINVIANKNGYVSKIHTMQLGTLVCELGAGRKRKEDTIEFSTGIMVRKKVTDRIEKGEILAVIHSNTERIETLYEKVLSCFEISDERGSKEPLIYKVI